MNIKKIDFIKTDSKKINPKIIDCLFSILLFLYSLRHTRYGVEWWDTGYSYANFLFIEHMDPMWKFSTFLANVFGHLFTKLPFGDRMIGMNFYTGLIVTAMAIGGYFFFAKKLGIPKGIAFLGEMIALSLSWCPTAVLYNYLTYLFFGVALVCIYEALTVSERPRRKRLFLILAGALLGINIFVRFPNLVQMGLILALWGYGWITKKKKKEVLFETLWCIIGYLAGIALCLTVISLRYGFFEYIDAIVRLMNMPSEASAYTPMSMIMGQIRTYLQNLRWLSYPAMLAAFGTLLFTCLPKRLRKVFYLPYVGIVFLLFWYLARRSMYNFNYLSLASMLQWAFFLLTLLILIGVRTLFHKKENTSVKLMVLLALLFVFITPIGTNNHLIASINNLYFVAPFLLWLYIRAFGPLPASLGRWSLFPIKSTLACIFVMIFIQVGLCGWVYVFQEATGGENLHTRVENNDILRGMLTTPDRADVISSLTSYVTQEDLKGKEIILYGMIPALSYYLEMPFAISP
ncbi:MAG: hypothetical protein LBM60_08975, partial [Clostridium sp.]|nr:hypothetical protein [Clostridium sp.]